MKPISVLIVDDVPFMRQFIRNCIEVTSAQFEIDEASNGQSAIEKIKEYQYAVVLCDWELPDIKGDEILSWLRNESDYKDMPFIMVTGNGEKEFITKALQLGVTDYVVKPVSCDVLARKMVSALRSP